MRAQGNWGESQLPEDNLLSKGKNWVELRKHMTNCPIYPSGKGLPLLSHPSHWHQWRCEERGREKPGDNSMGHHLLEGTAGKGEKASSLLPSLALNPMCLSANLWLIQDSPLEDTRRPAPTSMRPSMGFKKRNHPLLPSFLLTGKEWQGVTIAP